MGAELDHLSYSSISTWLACPRNFKYRYIDKVPEATSPALVFGSAFHNTVECAVRALVAGESPSLTELWSTHWYAQLEKEGSRIAWDGDNETGMFNDGVRMFNHKDVRQAITDLLPMLDQNGPRIEVKIELRVPEVPIPLIGYIDMIGADGTPYDFKTSAKSWGADKAQSEIQPLFYLAALMQSGVFTPVLKFRHLIFVKTKTPVCQLIESTYRTAEIFWLLEMIQAVWKAIAAGHYPPCPLSWKCSPQYCSFWSMCRGR